MRTSTGILLTLASLAGAAAGLALTKRRSSGTRALAAVVGFAAPWGLRAAVASPSSCTVLWITDVHGSPVSNAALVEAMTRETGVDRVLNSGDVVDTSDQWPTHWDRPFALVTDRWPVDAASGNHDHEDDATYAGFVDRFGHEPKTIVCGNAEFFLVPWGTGDRTASWLYDHVRSSTARWKVLVTHRPVWGVDGNEYLARILADSIPYLDLVLAGHQHVSWDSTHDVDGHLVRQIIDVSGPKKYDCLDDVEGCVQDETAYWRITFGDGISAVRKVVHR